MLNKPKRIVNPSGVNFRFDDNSFIPESRKNVFSIIENNITNPAENSSAMLILGNWGEGKTYIFDNLIPSKIKSGQIAFKLPTKTILNYLQSVIDTTITDEGERFLYALYNSVSVYYENEYFEKLKKNNKIDAKAWLVHVHNYFKAKHDRNVFFLIDEFEEFITERSNPQLQSIMLSGLKSALNEDSLIFNEKPGLYQFVLNCTPSAYYQIRRDPNFNETTGGIYRRINEITLRPARKTEAFDFISKIIKWEWEGKHPGSEFMEFSDQFTELFGRLGLNNFGFIQSLISKISYFNEKINHNNLIKFLKETNIVDKLDETYLKSDVYSIFEQIGDGIIDKDQLNLFLTYYGPFNMNQINKFLKNQITESKLIEFDYQVKSRYSKKMLIKVKKINSSNDIENLIKNTLQESNYWIKHESQEYYKSHNIEIERSIFEDHLIYNSWDFQKDKTEKVWYLPENEEDFFNLFPMFNLEDKYMFNCIKKAFENKLSEESYYIINPNLLELIYPTEIPLILNFVENQELRASIWRDLDPDKNFKELFFEGLLEIFSSLPGFINNNQKLDTDISYNNVFSVKISKDDSNLLNIVCAIFKSKIVNEDIHALNEYIRNKFLSFDPINLCFFIHTEPLSEKVTEIIDYKDLTGENSYFPNFLVNFVPTLSQIREIMFLGRLSQKIKTDPNIKINSNGKDSFIFSIREEIFSPDIKDNYLGYLAKKGFLVNPLNLKEGVGIKDFTKFYHQILRLKHDKNYDTSDLLKEYEKVSSLKKFTGGAKELITYGDFGEVDFKKYIEALKENGFYIIDQNYARFENSSIENSLIKLLISLKLEKIPVENIRKLYYDTSDDKNVLLFYLNLLYFKGFIEYEKESIIIFDFKKKKKSIKEGIENFKKIMNEPSKDLFINHIFITKLREERLITKEDFASIFAEYTEIAEKYPNETFQNSFYLMINEIMEYFTTEIKPHFDASNNYFMKPTGLTLFEEKIQEIKKKLDEIYKELTKYTKNIKNLMNLAEYTKISEIDEDFKNFKSSYSQIINKQQLKDYIEEMDDDLRSQFFFRDLAKKSKKSSKSSKLNENQTGNLFIVKIYSTYKKLVEDISQNIEGPTSNIKMIFETITDQKDKNLVKLSGIQINSECKVASKLYNQIYKNIENEKIDLDIDLNNCTSFLDINKHLMKNFSGFSIVGKFSDSIDLLKKIIKEELKYNQNRLEFQRFVSTLFEKCKILSNIFSRIKEINEAIIDDITVKDDWTLQTFYDYLIESNKKMNLEMVYCEIIKELNEKVQNFENKMEIISKISSDHISIKNFETGMKSLKLSIKKSIEYNLNALCEIMDKIIQISELLFKISKGIDQNDINIMAYIDNEIKKENTYLTKADILKKFDKFIKQNNQEKENLWNYLTEKGFLDYGYKIKY